MEEEMTYFHAIADAHDLPDSWAGRFSVRVDLEDTLTLSSVGREEVLLVDGADTNRQPVFSLSRAEIVGELVARRRDADYMSSLMHGSAAVIKMTVTVTELGRQEEQEDDEAGPHVVNEAFLARLSSTCEEHGARRALLAVRSERFSLALAYYRAHEHDAGFKDAPADSDEEGEEEEAEEEAEEKEEKEDSVGWGVGGLWRWLGGRRVVVAGQGQEAKEGQEKEGGQKEMDKGEEGKMGKEGREGKEGKEGRAESKQEMEVAARINALVEGRRWFDVKDCPLRERLLEEYHGQNKAGHDEEEVNNINTAVLADVKTADDQAKYAASVAASKLGPCAHEHQSVAQASEPVYVVALSAWRLSHDHPVKAYLTRESVGDEFRTFDSLRAREFKRWRAARRLPIQSMLLSLLHNRHASHRAVVTVEYEPDNPPSTQFRITDATAVFAVELSGSGFDDSMEPKVAAVISHAGHINQLLCRPTRSGDGIRHPFNTVKRVSAVLAYLRKQVEDIQEALSDKNSETLHASQIRPVTGQRQRKGMQSSDWDRRLRVGQAVMVKFPGRDNWYAGHISSSYDEEYYEIDFDEVMLERREKLKEDLRSWRHLQASSCQVDSGSRRAGDAAKLHKERAEVRRAQAVSASFGLAALRCEVFFDPREKKGRGASEWVRVPASSLAFGAMWTSEAAKSAANDGPEGVKRWAGKVAEAVAKAAASQSSPLSDNTHPPVLSSPSAEAEAKAGAEAAESSPVSPNRSRSVASDTDSDPESEADAEAAESSPASGRSRAASMDY